MWAIFGEITALGRYSNKNLCSIMSRMEHYRVRDGVQRRIHKEYVDVVAHFTKGGSFEPIAVCWKDGRTFPIDEILEIGAFGPPKHGKREMRYRIRFGGHETELYLERRDGRPMTSEPETLRWWVFAFDRKPKPRRG